MQQVYSGKGNPQNWISQAIGQLLNGEVDFIPYAEHPEGLALAASMGGQSDRLRQAAEWAINPNIRGDTDLPFEVRSVWNLAERLCLGPDVVWAIRITPTLPPSIRETFEETLRRSTYIILTDTGMRCRREQISHEEWEKCQATMTLLDQATREWAQAEIARIREIVQAWPPIEGEGEGAEQNLRRVVVELAKQSTGDDVLRLCYLASRLNAALRSLPAK